MAALKGRKTLVEWKSFLWPLTVKVEKESTWRMWDKVVHHLVVVKLSQGPDSPSPLSS